MQLYAYILKDNPHPVDIFAPLHHIPYSLFFDSADRAHPLSRYSFIAYHPFETIEAHDGTITVTNSDQQLSFTGDPFDVVRQRVEGWGMDAERRDDLPPFQGGAAGFFGYDLARAIENLPAMAHPRSGMPDLSVGLYDKVAAFDHAENKAWFIALAHSEKEADIKYAQFQKLQTAPIRTGTSGAVSWRASCEVSAYRAKVKKVIDYIYEGDIFQANISQRFEAVLPEGFDSFAHYRTMRGINPAPFSSYMNFGNGLILSSASPERFLSVQNRQVETRPIKGTRRRHADPGLDDAAKTELAASEKDRAENTMIVDLLRNDISKVCEDFSVRVLQLCGLESFATVHHLVSVISGILRADKHPADLLRACFPGGSITGAPKVRAMEIIEEMEETRRGPYCGAMGYIGFNGAMDTNIAIRTVVYDGNTASINAGGGIVADSDPDAEYQETIDKAEAIFRSFEENAGAEERAA